MNLQELKEMVQEEYTKFLDEQDDEKKDDASKGDDKEKKDKDEKGTPKKTSTPKVKAGADDLDVNGDDDPEKTLKDIYDMLKDFFEGDKDNDKPEAPKMDTPDLPGGDAPMPEAMPMMENNEKKSPKETLQEALTKQRFKKLANIIK